jgi:hypothetical protein
MMQDVAAQPTGEPRYCARSLNDVIRAVRRIKRCEMRMEVVEHTATEQRGEINQWERVSKAAIDREIAELVAYVQPFVDAELAAAKAASKDAPKSINLPGDARAGTRVTGGGRTQLYDEQSAVAFLREHGYAGCVRVVPDEVDVKALKVTANIRDGAALIPVGEAGELGVVPGVRFPQPSEQFYVETGHILPAGVGDGPDVDAG